MEILETALFFWNDWIIGVLGLSIGVVFWNKTRRPAALVVAIGAGFMFLGTVMTALFKSTPARDPLSYFYGGASEATGLLGVGLLIAGGVWYLVHDQKTVQAEALKHPRPMTFWH
jgi:predicted membrane channel-forming protein YqfA (hemolysin III family)